MPPTIAERSSVVGVNPRDRRLRQGRAVTIFEIKSDPRNRPGQGRPLPGKNPKRGNRVTPAIQPRIEERCSPA